MNLNKIAYFKLTVILKLKINFMKMMIKLINNFPNRFKIFKNYKVSKDNSTFKI